MFVSGSLSDVVTAWRQRIVAVNSVTVILTFSTFAIAKFETLKFQICSKNQNFAIIFTEIKTESQKKYFAISQKSSITLLKFHAMSLVL
jgi:hypothetical protein